MARVLCVGVATLDNIYRVPEIPNRGTKIRAEALVRTCGGMAANGAVAAARLGGEVSLWTRVGADAEGDQVRAVFAAEGIDVDHVRAIDGAATTVAAILVDAAGERLACPWFDPKLNDDPAWLPLDTIGAFDGVLADVRWPAAAEAVLLAARAAGVTSVLDADVAPAADLRRLAGLADYAMFSADGARALCPDGSLEAAAASLAAAVPGVVGITDGAAGCLLSSPEGVVRVPTMAVTAVDTLAAGDVFHGAFALAIAENQPVADAARFGNVAAALKCEVFGGVQGAPDRRRVEAVLIGQ